MNKRPVILIIGALILVSLMLLTKAQAQNRKRNIFPRIGIINEKLRFSSDLDSDCASHMISLRSKKDLYETIVFLSKSDGTNAVMNLNGSDRQLKKVKATYLYRNDEPYFAYHEYVFGKWQIIVSFVDRPGYVTNYQASIVVKFGRFSRTYKAVGLGQCDDD